MCSIGSKSPVLQILTTSRSDAVACGNIPADNTVPQQTEGTEIFTLTITPKYANSLLEFNCSTICSQGDSCALALFKDSGANAIAATTVDMLSNGTNCLHLNFITTAGSTSPATYKVRAGASNPSCSLNTKSAGTRVYGGVASSFFSIRELAV